VTQAPTLYRQETDAMLALLVSNHAMKSKLTALAAVLGEGDPALVADNLASRLRYHGLDDEAADLVALADMLRQALAIVEKG
jgi:hypothetical protein